ncbi:MAG: START domain-containing protein [Polyangia bacterium]
MRRPLLLVLLCTPLCAPSLALAADGPWKPVRSDDQIVVQRRHVDGSSLDEFRGVGLVEAPIAAVLALMDDAAHRTEWLGNSVANVRIEQNGRYDEIFYTRTGAPWPVSDRDAVVAAHLTLDSTAHEARIDMHSVTHSAWPPQKGVVRMPSMTGHWSFRPEHEGAWTRIEYEVHADPGGRLPDWVVNLATRKLPHDTILGLRKQLRRRQYPDAQREIEKDPKYQAVLAR